MERLIFIFIILLFFGCRCDSTSTNREKARQVYYSNKGVTVSIFPNGDNDIIFIQCPMGEGWCNVTNDPQPLIHDIVNDTIILQYDWMHNVLDADTVLTGFIKQLVIGQHNYVIKGEFVFFYNGNAIGSIKGMAWDNNYLYYVDSVSHKRDTVCFYKGAIILYKSNQRNVVYDCQRGYWEAYYPSEELRGGHLYKMKKSVRFKKH